MRSGTRMLVAACLAMGTLIAPVQRASAQADPRDDASPWAVASGAEWAEEYPRFNPALKEAGVRWLRLFDEWQTVQPRPGVWNWASMDRKVADARANGIHISGGLWYFAPWASATGDTRTGPVKDMRFWREYATAAFTRYKADVKYWEVWNELNGSFYKTRTNDKPKDYAALVREAYVAAKSVDPKLMVGLSCANFDLGFLDAAIKAGAAGHFDFVAVHPYENLAMVMDGQEASYLSLAGSIRKMLADNEQPAEVPLWITETGIQAPIEPHPTADARQAEALTKVYVLSIAQGFSKVFWFEARGPAYGQGTDHGLIRADWSPRPALTAMKTMTGLLGAEPTYVGWLDVGGDGTGNGAAYGFVFDTTRGPVLVTWATAAKATSARTTFGADVRLVDQMGDELRLPAGEPLALTRAPVYVADLPDDLANQARANAAKPFPWGKGFADATEVRCRLAATNVEEGVSQVKLETTEVVNLLDQSYRRSTATRGGEGHYAYFRVDPQFASFGNRNLAITLVARRADPNVPASTQITYESLRGYKGVKNGRWEIPAGDEWHEHTWTVTDANFVGGWGWNFRTDAAGSRGEFLIKEVRVRKTGAEAK